jgi:hypothetical protein
MGKAVFTPQQGNWRMGKNDGVNPLTYYAVENTKGSLDTNSDKVRMRATIVETGGATGSAKVLTVEWSDDDASWNSMGAASEWNYADGMGTEGNTVARGLSDADTDGEFHESGTNPADYGDGLSTEVDVCITPGSIHQETQDYYFRIKLDGVEVPLGSGKTHAQITTVTDPVVSGRSFGTIVG